MRQDALARRSQPDAPAPDYDALCAALSATARGRAFLDEHARRARQADTALALEALTRLDALLRQRDDEAETKARLRSELRALLASIASARTNFNKFEGMLAKRETVMALFDMLEQRITEMLAEAPEEIELPANENEMLAAAMVAQSVVAVAEQSSSAHPRDLSAEALAKAESGDERPRTSEPVALDPRLRGDERGMVAPPSLAAEPAEPASASTSDQPSDIVGRINALTPAERIALFS